MKASVNIPHNLCGFDKLSHQEEANLFKWYNEQRDKLHAEPKVKEFLALASEREKIRLDCIAEHGEYTVAFSKAFQTRCQEEFPCWPEQKKAYEAKFKPIEEELNRKTLAITWKRQTSVDVLGKPLLSPEEWLTAFDNATILQKQRMELPYVEAVRPVGKEPFHADRLIVDNLQTILDLGFATSESCSGMLADHPDRRYYKDSPDNGETYKAGQPRHQTLYGCNAYVAFPKPESNWAQSLKNTQQQIETVRRIAQENGWVAIDTNSLLQPELRLELPMTYDGSSIDDIIREAEKLGERNILGFHTLSYPDKVAAMIPLNKQVATQHGGIIPWTDPLIADRWNALSLGLKKAVEIQRMNEADLNRITNARIITKRDGTKAVRCVIDGIQQSMKDISKNIQKKLDAKEISTKEACASIFKEILTTTYSADQQINNGVKR